VGFIYLNVKASDSASFVRHAKDLGNHCQATFLRTLGWLPRQVSGMYGEALKLSVPGISDIHGHLCTLNSLCA
jgi:hypothetical protein